MHLSRGAYFIIIPKGNLEFLSINLFRPRASDIPNVSDGSWSKRVYRVKNKKKYLICISPHETYYVSYLEKNRDTNVIRIINQGLSNTFEGNLEGPLKSLILIIRNFEINLVKFGNGLNIYKYIFF